MLYVFKFMSQTQDCTVAKSFLFLYMTKVRRNLSFIYRLCILFANMLLLYVNKEEKEAVALGLRSSAVINLPHPVCEFFLCTHHIWICGLTENERNGCTVKTSRVEKHGWWSTPSARTTIVKRRVHTIGPSGSFYRNFTGAMRAFPLTCSRVGTQERPGRVAGQY